MSKKRIVLLGSTGSVGRNVLDVVSRHGERFEVVGLAAGCNADRLAMQCADHPAARFALCDEAAHERMTNANPDLETRSVGVGSGGLLELIDRSSADLVVNCLLGFVGLEPTLHALSKGIPVAIANKEAIVTGGELIRHESRRSGAPVIPIDSEHAAISQCLQRAAASDVKTVYITSSGGALRDRPLDQLSTARVEDVLAHPNWDMGDKITVDSATLVNKGLEVIEAHWLFDLPFDRIKVVIHPQSIVHALVEFRDNSIIAQMGLPDMRLPILYALTYPERIDTELARSDITSFPNLTFAEVDEDRYPCLGLAFRAAREGGSSPTVLSSANEAAVGAFLAGSVPFSDIYTIIQTALDGIPHSKIGSFEDVFETDRMTRAYVEEKFGLKT